MSKAKHDQLYQDLILLKLNHIADHYREVLDEAARKNSPLLEVMIQLVNFSFSMSWGIFRLTNAVRI
jgi:hypothetical protein